MINVGEESGAMDEMLKEIAEMTDIETEDLVKKLTATIEPLITVFMGIMILTLSLSIFYPSGICMKHLQILKCNKTIHIEPL